MISRQPVLFLAHGDPMNALAHNGFTRSLEALGQALPVKPATILMISAHWLTRGTVVSGAVQPETIYDFGGFPDELYRVTYPAPGNLVVAKQIIDLLGVGVVDHHRGIDHGAWSVLTHLFPHADIPVVSLGIDFGREIGYYVELGKQLATLRDENILIVGSGNIVHNVGMYFRAASDEPYVWATAFDNYVKKALIVKDWEELSHYERSGEIAKISHPTNDHLLPLFYCIGASNPMDEVVFPYEEVIRSMSMRCVRFG